MIPFKIAVIGTINRDVIFFPDKRKKISWGGIAYNICTLSALLGKKAEIYPVCNVGEDSYSQLIKFLSKFSNIQLEGIRKVAQKHNTCYLLYNKDQNREEFLKGKVPALNFGDIRPFLDSDAILINFISGWDVSLKVLQRIRREFRGLIFMDLHSLTLGIDRNKKRFLRQPQNWKAYVKCADLLQLNKNELETVLNKRLNFSDLTSGVKKILKLGSKILLLTLGTRGAMVGWKKGRQASIKKIPGIPLRKVVDNIGCGDVFSGAFLVSYLVNKKVIKSAQLANDLAARKCQFSGVEKIINFAKMKLSFS